MSNPLGSLIKRLSTVTPALGRGTSLTGVPVSRWWGFVGEAPAEVSVKVKIVALWANVPVLSVETFLATLPIPLLITVLKVVKNVLMFSTTEEHSPFVAT